MSEAGDDSEIPEFDAAPLSRWERSAASALGLGLSGAGVAAVFMTSNQAGSVALLLVGVVLLLMAINGSPLTRARYQDYEVFMARKRRRVVANLPSESPEDARQALQVLNTIDPGARRDPLVARASAQLYEAEVIARLKRTYPDIEVGEGRFGSEIDAIVTMGGRRIGVEVVGNGADGVLLRSDLQRVVKRVAARRLRPTGPSFEGLLIVTSKAFPVQAGRRIRDFSEIMPIGVVRWLDEQDDQALVGALQELSDRLGATS